MKIFEIITSVSLGGAENFTFSLVEQCSLLYPTKFEFVVIELYSTKTYYALRKKVELRSKGIRVITLSGTGKRLSLILAPFVLLKHIRKEKPASIHSHTDLPDLVLSVVLKFAKLKNTKIIRTIHNTELWGTHTKLGKFVESAFNKDYIIGVSEAAREAYITMRKKFNLPVSDKTTVIYNGCISPGKDIHHFKLGSNKINIAFCGRLVFQKGIDILAKVLLELDEELNSKFLFHIIGDGPDRDLVTNLTNKKDNVIYYGSVSNLSEKLYDFDYLLIPSRFEGLSLISVESSMSGVPVIPANIPGLNETIPKDWPLLFNLSNPKGIESVLTNLAKFEYRRDELKKTAFDFASKRFSIENMTESYSTIYLTN